MQRLRQSLWLGALLPALLCTGANAETYPSKPITVIVPFAAGGPVDLDTRRYTVRLSEVLGQPVVVEYRPGAGTSIGSGDVAKAKPDGYTLLADSSAFAVFPAYFDNLPFDATKDLVPITIMHETASVLLVAAKSPMKTFADYLTYTRANPGKLNYGNSGTGSISHLGGVWMQQLAKSEVTFVPFKGNSAVLLDLAAGRIQVGTASLETALPFIRGRQLRALAVTGAGRVPQLPDTAAVREFPGMQDYVLTNWYGFFAPKGLPPAVFKQIDEALIEVAQTPKIKAELQSESSTPVLSSAEASKIRINAEIERWKTLIKEAGVKP